jgi:hypothetical protein
LRRPYSFGEGRGAHQIMEVFTMRSLTQKRATFLLLCAGLTCLSASAQADGARDVQVAARVLTFLENAPSGRAVVGVVFDPSKPASVAEKDEVMATLGDGMAVGGLTIVGKPVEAGSAPASVVALIVTHGVDFAAVGQAAKARKLVTIGLDMACVNSGACAVGVASTPKVEIVVNRETTASLGVSFKAAFRLMIKEL